MFGVQSVAAIYNTTLIHKKIQMEYRHGRHVLAPAQAGYRY
jgi:hypothetical protein